MSCHEKNQSLVIASKHQQNGKGTQGRHWLSLNHLSQLMVSFCIKATGDVKRWPFLNMSLASCIANVLRHKHKLDACIKWPNDIYLNQKKVGGILSEVFYAHEHKPWLLFGFGINLFSDNLAAFHALVPNADCIFKRKPSEKREMELLKQIISNFETLVNQPLENHQKHVKQTFKDIHHFKDQWVTVKKKNTSRKGKILGIDDFSKLILMDENHRITEHASGTLSLAH